MKQLIDLECVSGHDHLEVADDSGSNVAIKVDVTVIHPNPFAGVVFLAPDDVRLLIAVLDGWLAENGHNG